MEYLWAITIILLMTNAQSVKGRQNCGDFWLLKAFQKVTDIG
jgi:hypothetical protein